MELLEQVKKYGLLLLRLLLAVYTVMMMLIQTRAAVQRDPSSNIRVYGQNETPCVDSTWSYSNQTGMCYKTLKPQAIWEGAEAASIQCPLAPDNFRRIEPATPKHYTYLTTPYKCKPGYEPINYTALRLEPTTTTTTTTTTLAPSTTTAVNATQPPTTPPREPQENIGERFNLTCDLIGREGVWSNKSELGDCKPLHCPPVVILGNATVNDTNTEWPTSIEYTCINPGYHLSGDNETVQILTCGDDGYWAPKLRQCDPVPCPNFPPIENATLSANSTTYRGSIVAQCIEGYMFPDGNIRKWIGCIDDQLNRFIGRWNESLYNLKSCEPLHCPKRELPELMTWTDNVNSTVYQTEIEYTCIENYEFPDSSTSIKIRCTLEAHWSSKLPVCSKIKPSLVERDGQKYKPPEREADNAQYIGVVSFALCLLLLLVIILLDLPTIAKDIRRLRHNLRYIKRLAQKRAQNNREKEKPLAKNPGQKYDPPKTEAPSGETIGTVAITLIVIMVCLIILLDLATIARDFKLLKSNLKHMKKRFSGSSK
ncbi:CUB and sushi domain-containing protein 3-like [Tubulanus polymorphus]|uniref:CUB and sushi domain-containing protein 3-like n=1 Tax=Tubulanus polymorphus TaxID=672921 RepID=UPI003DA6A6F5